MSARYISCIFRNMTEIESAKHSEDEEQHHSNKSADQRTLREVKRME